MPLPLPSLPLFTSVCGAAVLYFIILLCKARSDFYHSKVKKGLPMPPWNPLFGHLLTIDNAYKTYSLPADIQMPDVLSPIAKDFDDESDSLFYLDLWPFTRAMVMVSSPNYAQQAELIVDRPDTLLWSMHALTGGPSIFTSNGSEWKDVKDLLLPGFNANYIYSNTMIHTVDQAEILVKILMEKARTEEIFQLDPVVLKYMMDISGASTFNKELRSQTHYNAFTTAMRRSIDWHYLGDAFSTIARRTPLIRVIDWYNSRIMKKYLSDVLDARYKDWLTGSCVSPDAVNKSTLDLILANYMSKHKDKAPDTLDAGFKAWAIPQLRIMFFVGHDSGTATLCYAFYLLSRNASALEKMHAEHDDIFGADISTASHLMRTQPHLLNKLAYTTAVIKEVLRLFTPASGFRFGNAETELHSNGKRYPTENTNVWILHSALHRNPRYWKDASLFIPERFLVGPEDALYPIKGAWRPFEHGPRDCIGQALAMSTLRVSLVMLVRTFDVKPAYDEWDHIHNHRISTKRVCRFDGERAYQVGQSGAHPADGLPCRIIVRERKTVGI